MNETTKSTPLSNQRINIDIPAAVFFLLLAAYILITAGKFPNLDWEQGGSPAFYPRILGVMLVTFSLLLIGKGRKAPTMAEFPARRRMLFMLACLIGCFLMPLVLFPLLGFRISAALFMFFVMLGGQGKKMERKDMLKLTLGAIAVSVIIYGAFAYIARVDLPSGAITGW